jgi:RNA polymerase sigma-70 factor (ECF subfamily)
LIALCRRKHQDAFDVFIKRYERRIYSRAFRLAGNAEDAHDIAAVTRLRIYQNVDRIQSTKTLSSWINRIVTNAFIDFCRMARRNAHVSFDVLREQSDYSLAFGHGRLSRSPHALVESEERMAIVNQAINALPENLGLAFSLCYINGRSYEQIAGKLNIPIGTVKSRLNRARVSLRQRLSSLLPDIQ